MNILELLQWVRKTLPMDLDMPQAIEQKILSMIEEEQVGIEVRPWGTYEVLLDAENVKVKRIIVNPGQRLSYQYHFKRQEQWTCIEGTLSIVLNGATVEIEPGNSIHIPQGAHHRAWNRTENPVTFIEVQTGTYFGEDDIVRLEDDYKRI